jgi:cadmium resistance protein CadD (predicted permease)
MASEQTKSIIGAVALAGACLAISFVPSTVVIGVLFAVPIGVLGVAACFTRDDGGHED